MILIELVTQDSKYHGLYHDTLLKNDIFGNRIFINVGKTRVVHKIREAPDF